jgi:hypothetical protein
MLKIATLAGIGAIICASVAFADDRNSTQRFDEAFQDPSSLSNSAILSLWGGGILIQTGETDFDDGSIFTFGGDARSYIGLSDGRGVQWELSTLYEDDADGDADIHPTVDVTGGAHLITRGGAADYGLFTAISYATHNDQRADSIHIIGGVEASTFRDMTQYFVQFGAQFAVGGGLWEGYREGDKTTWQEGIFGSIGARHFQTENAALLAQATVGGLGTWKGRNSQDDNAIWAQAVLEYENHIDGLGLSGFVGYQGDYIYDYTTPGWGDTLFNHAIKIGLRKNFGAGETAYSLAKNGAGTFSLPDLHTPFSYTGDLLAEPS